MLFPSDPFFLRSPIYGPLADRESSEHFAVCSYSDLQVSIDDFYWLTELYADRMLCHVNALSHALRGAATF